MTPGNEVRGELPSWLKEVEKKLDPVLSPFSHEQLDESDVLKLLSALKLSIEGLEDIREGCPKNDMRYLGLSFQTRAREILEKVAKLGSGDVKRGEV